ncbi:MAG TPA: TadE/TadG family type IV pilus assembly protein [Pirellulaceae bacterium]|nr:TadE/TadG family type IV pilus assembly protein [Pirellulaceae bacterium]
MSQRSQSDRRGAAAVEMALTFPVFLLFLFGLLEFGHLLMVKAALTSAAKEGARMGSIENASTADVQAFIENRISRAFPSVAATIYIKDASVYDSSSPPSGPINPSTLPDIELSTTESRHMFVVQIDVAYSDVAIFPPFWASNVQLTGISILRHE